MASVTDYTIDNASGSVVRGDINAVFAAIVSNYSSGTEPNTTVAYQFWADTSTTPGKLKIRNSSNDGWIVLRELDGTMLLENGTAAAPGLTFDSDVDTGIFRAAADELGFATAGTEVARFNDSGWLGINTDPLSRFHVNGDGFFSKETTSVQLTLETAITSGLGPRLYLKKARGTIASRTTVADQDSLGKIIFQGYTGSAYETGYEIRSTAITQDGGAGGVENKLTFNNAGTEVLKLGDAGGLTCLGVYDDTTTETANVYVSSSGKLARGNTSSIKYKTDVETLEDSYADALLECRPVWYRSLCTADNPEHGWWGFIAEEVAEIDPRLVTYKTIEVTHDEDANAIETPCTPEPESVKYDRFVPHLLNLVKRQKAAIEALEARVTALEGA